jgi:hypothetical protein
MEEKILICEYSGLPSLSSYNLKEKNMENLQIKITITDGEKEVKTTINVDDYKTIKKLHGVSMLDDLVDVLLQDIRKK